MGVQKMSGSIAIVAKRIGAGTAEFPIEIFGASNGSYLQDNGGSLASYKQFDDKTLADNDNAIGFLPNGNLTFGVWDATSKAIDEGIEISCKRVSYKELLIRMRLDAFMVSNIKVSYSVLASISEDLKIVSNNIFGDEDKQTFSMIDSFDKDQQQSKIIDIEEVFPVDESTVISSTLVGTETELTYVFDVSLN